MAEYRLNVILRGDEDEDIIQFLQNWDKSAITKKALRFYMQVLQNAEEIALQGFHVAKQLPERTDQVYNQTAVTKEEKVKKEKAPEPDNLFGSWT